MYFYLKDTKAEKKTLIYFKYKNGSEKRFVYSTKVKISPKDWDFQAKFVKSKKGRTDLYILAKKISVYLDFFKRLDSHYEINNEKLTHQKLTIEFEDNFNKKKKKSILSVADWFDILIDEKRKPNTKIHTKYIKAKESLIQYAKSKNKELTFDLFADFTDFPKFMYKQYNYNDNSLSRHFGYIKTFLLWTYKRKLHDIRDFNLTLRYYQPDNVALTKEQVLELYNYDFENIEEQTIIDLFLIGCLTGQRFSDFSVFDKLDYHDGYITKRQKKTKAKVVIPVDANSMLKRLLYKYDFDLPVFNNTTFNITLKKTLNKLKSFQHKIKKISYQNGVPFVEINDFWQMISSHTARRSFITITLEDGWTYKEVMQVSGIKDISTLIKYDKVSKERLSVKTKETWSIK